MGPIMSKLNRISLLALLFGAGFYSFSFAFLDQPIAHAFQYFPHNYLFTSFQMLTVLGDSKISYGFIIFSFLISIPTLMRQPQNRLANYLLCAGLAMIIAILAETSLKYLLGRYRPELLFTQGLYGFHYLSHQFLMTSTPSGHATRVFVLVTGFAMVWKRFTPIFILIGLLVCLSRLVLEFHYLSDVVFGGLLGTFLTLWTARMYYSLTIPDSALPILN
jgi:membrane-associated phospholipid phosphatase